MPIKDPDNRSASDHLHPTLTVGTTEMDPLNLPTVLFAVFVLYWSSSLTCLLYVLKWADFIHPRADCYNWSWFMMKVMGAKVLKRGQSSLYRAGPCIYLCNHRSWADFFIDCYVTEGRAQLMSRLLVAAAFPVFMGSVYIIRGVVLFKRGAVRDKDKFNKWLDQQLADSPQPSLVVYPEGTRSHKPQSLPLKRGMLHYAFSRKLPVQVIMTANKEAVLSEKRIAAQFNATLITVFREPILTSDFDDFESFFTHLQKVWDETWSEAYSAEAASCKPLVHSNVEAFPYPFAVRIGQAMYSFMSILVFLGMLYVTYWVCGFLPLIVRRVSVSISILWVMASFWKSGAFAYAR